MKLQLQIASRIEQLYRTDSRRVLASLIRLLGDFDLAEEALADAFAAALKQWPADGMPDNPRAWLVSTGRFKAIDNLRRRTRHDEIVAENTGLLAGEVEDPATYSEQQLEDDHLRLIFTCCHPALSMDARVALTLREVCGLATEEIASAFLSSPSTMAQRIVRAKNKIRTAGIPYQVPAREELSERLDGVLQVIYLVFNEGYSASSGTSLTRADLCAEAIRLGRLLQTLLPDAEVQGLLALMLLTEARHSARADSGGALILLEDQDRSLWDQAMITEGCELVRSALLTRRFGPYSIQAAIAAVHAEAESFAATDWQEVVGLYSVLQQLMPSPVIALNRAVAVAMLQGPQAGLTLIEQILQRGELVDYYLAHAARADLCKRLGEHDAARAAYRRALELVQLGPEREFLQQQLDELV